MLYLGEGFLSMEMLYAMRNKFCSSYFKLKTFRLSTGEGSKSAKRPNISREKTILTKLGVEQGIMHYGVAENEQNCRWELLWTTFDRFGWCIASKTTRISQATRNNDIVKWLRSFVLYCYDSGQQQNAEFERVTTSVIFSRFGPFWKTFVTFPIITFPISKKWKIG